MVSVGADWAHNVFPCIAGDQNTKLVAAGSLFPQGFGLCFLKFGLDCHGQMVQECSGDFPYLAA